MKRLSWLVLLLLVAAFAGIEPRAAPLTRETLPDPLRGWIDWVLHDHQEVLCPFFNAQGDRRQCLWPSRLALTLSDREGRFTQQWRVYADGWVPLPGDTRVWPQQVRVDGATAVVTPQAGAPSVRLVKGAHTITGRFDWSALPPLLQIPPATGLLEVTLSGRLVAFPNRDPRGRLWLRKRAGEDPGESRLDVTVHRRVTDGIPLLLTSLIELQVSGKSREVLLGRALPERFVPLSLNSPLPARVEPDGHLRVQVRPGKWTVTLTARHEGPVESLTLPDPEGPWGTQEVWVFAAQPGLRLVSIEGVPGIDPQQTTLPDTWKSLPAYLMRPGRAMTLVEKRRGDSDPAPDRLSLKRTLWLDFDGGGFTITDRVTGVMGRGWRLDMPPPGVLGRVAVNGRDQMITRLSDSSPAGVEVRQGRVRLDADSRLESAVSNLAAVGWDQDFHQVAAQLNLPPGWRLFHASGVDDVSFTWISSWSLLDLFLVLIISLSVGRLWGPRWGALALVTLGLTWIEPGAPRWVWVAVLIGEALRRALPTGRPMQIARVFHRVGLGALVLFSVPFMARQVREAIYPVLEQPRAFAPVAGPKLRRAMLQAELADKVASVEDDEKTRMEEIVPQSAPAEGRSRLNSMGFVEGSLESKNLVSRDLYAPDPRAVVQTGPGLPSWVWKSVSLRWRGPVERTQRLHLMLIPPGVNFVLAFLRVLLLAFLGVLLFGFAPDSWPGAMLKRLRMARALWIGALCLSLAGVAPRPARADIPSPQLLETLRKRLLEKPDCYPNCASIPRLALEVTPTRLVARLEVQTAATTAVPLPGGAAQWVPQRVLVDGRNAPGLLGSGEGPLWVVLAPGIHQVLLEGRLPDRDTVQIPLPLKPLRVTARARGWRVDGLLEDGGTGDNLQLTRARAAGRDSVGDLEPGPLPPFVRVERNLRLGLKWEVETNVIRVSPAGAAILLEVPLLPGESVTTADVRVADGKALVSLGPQVARTGWTSGLDQSPTIRLKAPDSVRWTEAWRVEVGQMWHLEPEGIPVIHGQEQPEQRVRDWRPWPGEAVTLRVTRPEGLAGRTLTIDRSALTLKPGLRATDATLDLTLRSSRGAQHTVTLPAGAELQSVSINTLDQPIRQEGREVILPVVPGRQDVVLVWRQNAGMRALFVAPEVDIGTGSVNSEVRIAMPADRWTLLVRGPRLGPAVLFWSFIIIALLASVALGRVSLTPLRWHHWFLLSLGLTQVPIWVALLIAFWLLALGWRAEGGRSLGNLGFDLLQICLVALTLFALVGLFWSIQKGLLGLPEMQISGNGSTSWSLQWYLDRSGATLPRPRVVSLPLMVYRVAMLAWALWLAGALLGWLRWGWGCFAGGGLWRPIRQRVTPASS